jgi:hypothetical protein
MNEILHFKYTFSELGIKNSDIELILKGFNKESASDHFDEYISDILSQGDTLFSIKGGIVIFDNISFDRTTYTIKIDNVVFDAGKILVNQLKNSESLAIFLCTAGEDVSHLSKQLFREGDFPKGYIADVIGSAVVETAMDKMQEELKDMMTSKELLITNRYSPGYCGWNVSQQQKLFSLLPENFCNISLSEHSLMHPIKSVSGVIGIGKKVRFNPYTCQLCDLEECIYRNRQLVK